MRMGPLPRLVCGASLRVVSEREERSVAKDLVWSGPVVVVISDAGGFIDFEDVVLRFDMSPAASLSTVPRCICASGLALTISGVSSSMISFMSLAYNNGGSDCGIYKYPPSNSVAIFISLVMSKIHKTRASGGRLYLSKLVMNLYTEVKTGVCGTTFTICSLTA